MTAFDDAVVAVISALQPGDVITYGEVAFEAGYPGAARAVGNFLRNTDLELPWWRVVGSGGHIVSPDPIRQERLLVAEGVVVVGGRVRSAPSP